MSRNKAQMIAGVVGTIVGSTGEGGGHVKRLLQNMARHASVISRALHGPIVPGDDATNQAIEALVPVHVLLPYDDEAYHLNPNLRGFFLDHLNQFSAFETLTRISGTIAKIAVQWAELDHLQDAGEDPDAERLELAIDFAVTELIYSNERNLMLLNSQISTDYGNVDSLTAKLRQNTFYGRQAADLLKELIQVAVLLEKVRLSTKGPILTRVQLMISSRIGSRLGPWTTRLNDVMATISKRLFKNKVLDERLTNLAKVSLWLTKNPTRTGIDVHFDETMKPELLRPDPIKVRPHVDLNDTGTAMQTAVASIVGRLPTRTRPFEPPTVAPTVRLVTRRSMEVVQTTIAPVDEMVMDLVSALMARDAQPISIKHWQPEKREAQGLDEESWIFYASTQLSAQKVDIVHSMLPRMPGRYNALFDDVIAMPKLKTKRSAATTDAVPA